MRISVITPVPRKIIANSTLRMNHHVGNARIQRMIANIHRDIDKLYDELMPLDTGIDIDMVCYTEDYGKLLECVPLRHCAAHDANIHEN